MRVFIDMLTINVNNDSELVSIAMMSDTGRYAYGEVDSFDQHLPILRANALSDQTSAQIISGLLYTDVVRTIGDAPHFISSKKDLQDDPYSFGMKGSLNQILEQIDDWLLNLRIYSQEGGEIQFCMSPTVLHYWALLTRLFSDHEVFQGMRWNSRSYTLKESYTDVWDDIVYDGTIKDYVPRQRFRLSINSLDTVKRTRELYQEGCVRI
jgi:hypothetical protein